MAKMNARMMRAKMALEVAAEVYTQRMFSMGNVATISINPSSREEQFPGMTMGINGDLMGGMKGPLEVGNRRVDVAFINPSAVVTMAYRGEGFYKEKMPLRALASFPSWDKMVFAVAKELKVKSIYEIGERKIPLKVSTRSSGVYNTTSYTVKKILSLYGISFGKIKNWGGAVRECSRPTSPERLESIRKGKVNAVFDEGIHSWLDEALDHGFEVLPLEPSIVKQLEVIGYQRSILPVARYRKLPADIATIDFSGWPLITHRWLSNDLAYSICQAIDVRQSVIPVDDDSPLDMRKICRGTQSAPLGIPLHLGAKRYYQEKGYL
ncbi:MAG: TAXI family TRAP transporter solute-binding subunit [Candidatus Binatia bacterium]